MRLHCPYLLMLFKLESSFWSQETATWLSESGNAARLPHMAMWTKLRPQVREFLEGVHAMAEMHIYTHGDRDYAAAMALLLDPKRRFFQERIISQSDSTQRHTKARPVTRSLS